jgi:peroxiredoxin
MKRLALLFTAFFAIAIAAQAQGIAVGSAMENFTLPDVDGKMHSLDSLKGKNGSVVIFLSAQCPVVKGYNGRISQIAADYAAKGINFIGINSNATEDLPWVKSHAADNYKFPMLIDKGNKLADKLAANTTPEVYYLDAKNVLVYQGAIDNDRAGTAITDPYLKTAFDMTLAGKKIEKVKTNAVGCSIKRAKAE